MEPKQRFVPPAKMSMNRVGFCCGLWVRPVYTARSRAHQIPAGRAAAGSRGGRGAPRRRRGTWGSPDRRRNAAPVPHAAGGPWKPPARGPNGLWTGGGGRDATRGEAGGAWIPWCILRTPRHPPKTRTGELSGGERSASAHPSAGTAQRGRAGGQGASGAGRGGPVMALRAEDYGAATRRGRLGGTPLAELYALLYTLYIATDYTSKHTTFNGELAQMVERPLSSF